MTATVLRTIKGIDNYPKYSIVSEYGDDKIGDIKVNGKSVKRGFIRGFNKAMKTSYWKLYTQAGQASNPFSGEVFNLDPLELTIAKWCQNWYYNDYSRNSFNARVPVQAYDDMKYFLLHLNRDAYYGLLD